ncbi:MAG: phosphonoacetaldehyde hydrolase [Planctomycetaceae bacterium]|nr:phosphonoacetaldehyde hydrolase [Planctomycetaceae bacterium]
MTLSATRLQAVVFDWAGTTIDFGSLAPAGVFMEIFKQEGVEITIAQAREPMGRAKKEHLRAVLEMPDVKLRWASTHGAEATEADIDRMYEKFLPMQREVLAKHSKLIPGAVQTVDNCRSRGLKIGSSTGYTRELMEVVSPLAKKQGYEPDCVLCSGDTPAGRPKPWMLFEAAKRMDVYPMDTIVKVDDTVVGIEAGHNAGCWTVAITMSGNELGLTQDEAAALCADERAARKTAIEQKFKSVAPHYMIESVADLPEILDEIDGRLQAYGSPRQARS